MSNFGTTDFDYRVALGLVPGYTLLNEFAHNETIPVGTEVIAEWGGLWVPTTTADTLDLVSTSANDVLAGTGAETVRLSGYDGSWLPVTEDINLSGLTPVTTVNSYIAVNVAEVISSGTSQGNEGTINITRTTDLSTQAQIGVAHGVAHKSIISIGANQTGLIRGVYFNAQKLAGGSQPRIDIRGYGYSADTNTIKEIFRADFDTAVMNEMFIDGPIPGVVPAKSHIWFEATTDTANTSVAMRVSIIVVDN